MTTQPPACRYVTAGAQALHDYTDPLPYMRFVRITTLSRIGAAIPPRSRDLCHIQNVQTVRAVHQTVPGYILQKVKRPECEADNSTFPSAEA